jgi:hypothetical protein
MGQRVWIASQPTFWTWVALLPRGQITAIFWRALRSSTHPSQPRGCRQPSDQVHAHMSNDELVFVRTGVAGGAARPFLAVYVPRQQVVARPPADPTDGHAAR